MRRCRQARRWSCRLPPQDQHHARRVLRVRAGEDLDVVAPSGIVWHVRIRDVSGETISAEVLGESPAVSEPSVTLFQGVAKGDKMESIVRQAVEVGVAAVVPVLTSRCVVRIDGPKRAQRAERWRRISRSAAEQSRRANVPEVHDVVTFAEACGLLEAFDRVIVLWEEQAGSLVSSVVRGSFRHHSTCGWRWWWVPREVCLPRRSRSSETRARS